MEVAIRCVLAAVLAAAALLKLASPGSSQAALSTFGFERGRLQRAVWSAIVVAELGLAVTVAAGLAVAAYLAAGLLAVFAGALGLALARGKRGAPCACFGARSRVGPAGVVRNAVLAGAFAALPSLPDWSPGTDGWLAAGLGVALAAVLGLGVGMLALAREIGLLRLQLGPQPALELVDEGPPLGLETSLAARFSPGRRTRLALAVFSSEGCRICRSLEPAVAAVGRDPLVALEIFDEWRDARVWRELEIPGSPFAVALDLVGVVRAKGTFNNLGQLESILAAAERRSAESVGA